MALLHSFWYNEAGKQFEEIVQKDPGCAMAYWGEAMSFYHQLWDHPDEAHLKRGWELVKKAEATGEQTERERDYIEALAGFYRDYDNVITTSARPLTRRGWKNSTSNIPTT